MARRVSMNPDTYTQGGLIGNVDVRITYAKYVRWDYNGKAAQESPALLVKLLPLDGTGVEAEQYLSCGALKDFQPSEDGEWLETVSDDSPSGMRNSTNLAHWNNALAGLGIAKNKMDGSAQFYVGFELHVVRQKAPAGSSGTDMKEDREILVPSKLLKAPWDAGARKSAPPTTAANTAAANTGTTAPAADAAPATSPAAKASDEDKAAVTAALAIAFANTDRLDRTTAKKAVYSALNMPAARKKAAVELIFDADWMDSLTPKYAVDESGIEKMG